MRAEKVIRALLAQAAGVSAVVGDRIHPVPLPQGVTLPALGYTHVSTREHTGDGSASAAYVLCTSRIQVDVLAKDYPTQKSLLDEVRKACNYQRGIIAGVTVVSVLRAGVAHDERDDDMRVYRQSIDFLVTYQEP